MHRDQQIGLALGILLIGIVAAFFFRNDPDPLSEAPRLAAPEILDREIAERRVTPYITGLEPLPEESPSPRFQPPTFAEDPPEPNGPLAAAPDPIAAFGDPLASRFEAFPSHGNASPAAPPSAANAGWTPPKDPQPAQPESRFSTASQSRPSAAALRTHRVQAGDTLSGIALRYLGTSRRYDDVYRINADLMESPDDLRIGMMLRIPDVPTDDRSARPQANPVSTFASTPTNPAPPAIREPSTARPSLDPRVNPSASPFDTDAFHPHAGRPPFEAGPVPRRPAQPGDNSGWIPKPAPSGFER